jgi:uncharacterized protein
MSITTFTKMVQDGYTFKGLSFYLGAAKLEGKTVPGTAVNIPLSTMNRHGLIAGATGTGKTKTLQVITEALSRNGVPTLVMDIKGDLSGISQPGVMNEKIDARSKELGVTWAPSSLPSEFLSLNSNAVKVRSTLQEFGPVLLSKLMDLSDVQASVLGLIFKYCQDKNIPLLDFQDFKKVLQYYATDAGKQELGGEYGMVAGTSIGAITRKIIELEGQGVNEIFGEPTFNVQDLVRTNSEGKGYINILRLMDLQTKPQLFATFMLSLINKVYANFPELGDAPKPKLCLFIDEAHLIFANADNALISQIETTIKLIRSKGVGVFFITQNPSDIPSSVLSQLGLKVQHSLRAFTAIDRKAIDTAAKNYPISEYYTTENLLTELGIGEALVTCLNEQGTPAPLAHVIVTPPTTRMDVVSDQEVQMNLNSSMLYPKYKEDVHRESAAEILGAKIDVANAQTAAAAQEIADRKAATQEAKDAAAAAKAEKLAQKDSTFNKVSSNPFVKALQATFVRKVISEIMKSVMGGRK